MKYEYSIKLAQVKKIRNRDMETSMKRTLISQLDQFLFVNYRLQSIIFDLSPYLCVKPV